MKNRIKRAFTLDQPNVLPKILEDCADKAVSPSKTRRRLPERTARLISACLSFALIFAALFGGVVYFRSQYGQIVHHSSSPSGTIPDVPPDAPTDEPRLPENPHPDNTVDYDHSIEGLITRTDDILYPLFLRDEIYTVPDVSVIPMEENDVQMYLIHRQYQGHSYRFFFHRDSGALLRIDLAGDTCELENIFISPYAAVWIAAMDIAPEHFGLTSDPGAYGYILEQDYIFHVELEFAGELYSYWIDARNGNILYWEKEQATPDFLPLEQLRDMALALYGHDLDMLRTFKVYENGDTTEVLYIYDTCEYVITLDSCSGAIVYDAGASEVGAHPSEQMEHLIGWRKARDLCLEICGRDLKELIGFSWEYIPGDPDYYHIELTFFDDYLTFRVDALNGTFVDEPVGELIPEEKICEMVYYRAKLSEEAMQQLGMGAEGTDFSCTLYPAEDQYVYVVWMYIDSFNYYYRINAFTGQFLFEDIWDGPAQPEIYDDVSVDEAITLALQYVGYAQEDITDLACKYDSAQVCYWIYFACNDTHWEVCVHSATGEILQCTGYATDTPQTDTP